MYSSRYGKVFDFYIKKSLFIPFTYFVIKVGILFVKFKHSLR